MRPPDDAKTPTKPDPDAGQGLPSQQRSEEIPLLYGNHLADDADATPLVTPSEEEMARHLAAQLAAVQADRLAETATAPGPISAERTAQFAALDEATRASGLPRDFDETTLMLVRTESRSARQQPTTDGTLPDDDIAAELAAARALQNPSAAPALATSAAPQPATQIIDHTPRQVGRYRIHKRLGRGGMGTIYRAHDPELGRDVALKFLHASMCEDDDARDRFLREARAAGALAHPNIVAVHDVGEIEHRPYMAMELVKGMPLAAMLEQKGQLPIRDAVVMGIQLAQALDFAHNRGIVHRDIKPSNIMLLDDGQTIKVGDFGIADIAEPLGEGRSSGNTTGPVLGTPQYMSPEHTRGEVVDGRSDLFSAGVVLYQMLAGERPFRAENMVALATRIATEEAPPLLRKRPDVPASLRRAVDRCLAKSPEQRWQSGQELADALKRVLTELDEAQQQQQRKRPVSLALKWAAAMTLLTAVVTGLAAFWATQHLNSAALTRAGLQGAALAQILAAQHATQVLAEEWDSLGPQLEATVQTGQLRSLLLADANGVVRASSVAAQVGLPLAQSGAVVAELSSGATQGRRLGEGLLRFDSSIVLQGKSVGMLSLTVAEAPGSAARSWFMPELAALALVTTLAVAMGSYVLGLLYSRPILRLSEAMGEIGRGRLDFRIAQTRNDELGQAFASFDAMAQALQQQRTPQDMDQKTPR